MDIRKKNTIRLNESELKNIYKTFKEIKQLAVGKIGNDIHVVPVNYFIRIDQRRKTALHSEVRSFCKM